MDKYFLAKQMCKKLLLALNVFLRVSHSQVRFCTWLWVLLTSFSSALFTCMCGTFSLLKVIVTQLSSTSHLSKGGNLLNLSKYQDMSQNNPRKCCKIQEKKNVSNWNKSWSFFSVLYLIFKFCRKLVESFLLDFQNSVVEMRYCFASRGAGLLQSQ